MSLATMVLNRKYKRLARRTMFGEWKTQTANPSGCGQSRTCDLPVPEFVKSFLGMKRLPISFPSVKRTLPASLVAFSRRIAQ